LFLGNETREKSGFVSYVSISLCFDFDPIRSRCFSRSPVAHDSAAHAMMRRVAGAASWALLACGPTLVYACCTGTGADPVRVSFERDVYFEPDAMSVISFSPR